jgi:hypothetical protein
MKATWNYEITNRARLMRVSIRTEELGLLSGVVRWAAGNRIGIKLKLSTNTAAQIASFYKFFP